MYFDTYLRSRNAPVQQNLIRQTPYHSPFRDTVNLNNLNQNNNSIGNSFFIKNGNHANHSSKQLVRSNYSAINLKDNMSPITHKNVCDTPIKNKPDINFAHHQISRKDVISQDKKYICLSPPKCNDTPLLNPNIFSHYQTKKEQLSYQFKRNESLNEVKNENNNSFTINKRQTISNYIPIQFNKASNLKQTNYPVNLDNKSQNKSCNNIESQRQIFSFTYRQFQTEKCKINKQALHPSPKYLNQNNKGYLFSKTPQSHSYIKAESNDISMATLTSSKKQSFHENHFEKFEIQKFCQLDKDMQADIRNLKDKNKRIDQIINRELTKNSYLEKIFEKKQNSIETKYVQFDLKDKDQKNQPSTRKITESEFDIKSEAIRKQQLINTLSEKNKQQEILILELQESLIKNKLQTNNLKQNIDELSMQISIINKRETQANSKLLSLSLESAKQKSSFLQISSNNQKLILENISLRQLLTKKEQNIRYQSQKNIVLESQILKLKTEKESYKDMIQRLEIQINQLKQTYITNQSIEKQYRPKILNSSDKKDESNYPSQLQQKYSSILSIFNLKNTNEEGHLLMIATINKWKINQLKNSEIDQKINQKTQQMNKQLKKMNTKLLLNAHQRNQINTVIQQINQEKFIEDLRKLNKKYSLIDQS